MLFVAIITARRNAIPVAQAPLRPLEGGAAAACLLAIALLILVVRWPGREPKTKRRLYELLPHERGEMPLYLGLCAAAAVSEEVAYRGVAFSLLQMLSGSEAVAALLAAVAFALGHAIQGWRSVGAIFLFALGFHVIVLIAGSLWFAVGVHFAYDAIAGVLIPRWERARPV